MAIQQETGRFTLKNAIGTLAESISALWKPALVAAPLIGTALFFASGTQAQTSGSAAPSTSTSANGPVAPIATPEAAQRKGRKVRVRGASDTSRVANPAPTGEPAANGPIAPIASPEAARTGRPKIRVKEATGRVANPTPAADPVAATEVARTGGRPKERDDDARDTSRTGRPKERDDSPHDTSRTGGPSTDPATTTPNPSGERAIRKNVVPKATSRGSNLLLPALGGAAAIVAIIAASSGNDRPASP